MKKSLLILAIGCSVSAYSQIKIDHAVLFIDAGATVTIQGDITSNTHIQGNGLLQLKGSTLQSINMGGFSIPNLQLDNNNDAILLSSDTRITNSLAFTNGKIRTDQFSLVLGPSSTITGAGENRFVWTSGTGQLIRQINSDVTNLELPVGEANHYRPAFLSVAGGAYSDALFGVRVLASATPFKPSSTAAHLNTAWSVTKSGINGGNIVLSGRYIDPLDVSGNKSTIAGYYYDNATQNWSSSGETHDGATNRISVPVPHSSSSGILSGINKFILLGARVFLQGAYDSASGLMNDHLRQLPFGSATSTANFPSTDPYRVAPYSGIFTHVNNTVPETIQNNSIVATQSEPGNNIVDWVFIELRNLSSPNNTVLQTRSALLQRDGDIVDIDGQSPVTFNNIADGNYILSIRHRNHLALGLDPAWGRALNETRSAALTANLVDFTKATDAQLAGNSDAYATASHASGTVNLLWAGNVSGNGFVRYAGTNGPGSTNLSDRQVLLNDLGNNELVVQTGYFRGDINMNGIMRYQGTNGPGIFNLNDRQFLLSNILGNYQLQVRSQAILP